MMTSVVGCLILALLGPIYANHAHSGGVNCDRGILASSWSGGGLEGDRAVSWLCSTGREESEECHPLRGRWNGTGHSYSRKERVLKRQRTRNDISKAEPELAWEQFPHMGTLKTYSVDKHVPDSASTATALFCGVKTNLGVVGYDGRVQKEQIEEPRRESELSSILDWARDKGMATGVVTNTRLSHATPAALVAHSTSRDWECDATVPLNSTQKDIASQLISSGCKVLLGGGRASLRRPPESAAVSKWTCQRSDDRDLVEEFIRHHQRAKYVATRDELLKLDTNTVDYLLGSFSEEHMHFDDERLATEEASLSEMTEVAIRMLSKEKNGFILVVENGLIDQAHHFGWARRALHETLSLESAVLRALSLLDTSETLIIVTADHSHTLAIQGNPGREVDITGSAQLQDKNGYTYPILTYGNGPGGLEGTSWPQSKDMDAVYPALLKQYSAKHGGSDVGIWASGPFSHLFHKNHEQTHVAHVVAYALEMGPYKVISTAQSSQMTRNAVLPCGLVIALRIFQ